jgi:hypothetical protein
VPAQVAGARGAERSRDRIREMARLERSAFQRREDQALRAVGPAVLPLLARGELLGLLVSSPLPQQLGHTPRQRERPIAALRLGREHQQASPLHTMQALAHTQALVAGAQVHRIPFQPEDLAAPAPERKLHQERGLEAVAPDHLEEPASALGLDCLASAARGRRSLDQLDRVVRQQALAHRMADGAAQDVAHVQHCLPRQSGLQHSILQGLDVVSVQLTDSHMAEERLQVQPDGVGVALQGRRAVAARSVPQPSRGRLLGSGLLRRAEFLGLVHQLHAVDAPKQPHQLAGPVTDELRAARASSVNAISNIDILLNLVDAIS